MPIVLPFYEMRCVGFTTAAKFFCPGEMVLQKLLLLVFLIGWLATTFALGNLSFHANKAYPDWSAGYLYLFGKGISQYILFLLWQKGINHYFMYGHRYLGQIHYCILGQKSRVTCISKSPRLVVLAANIL